MGRRYYCDFCDKSFADNIASKKNHFNGTHHRKMRKAHYDSFRDPMTLLAEDASKRPCRSFQQTGFCNFGEGCRYSHLTEELKHHLKEECLKKAHCVATLKESCVCVAELKDWLTSRAESTEKTARKKSKTFPKYCLPPILAGLSNIPPSLLPPTAADFQNLPVLEWA